MKFTNRFSTSNETITGEGLKIVRTHERSISLDIVQLAIIVILSIIAYELMSKNVAIPYIVWILVEIILVLYMISLIFMLIAMLFLTKLKFEIEGDK